MVAAYPHAPRLFDVFFRIVSRHEWSPEVPLPVVPNCLPLLIVHHLPSLSEITHKEKLAPTKASSAAAWG